MEFISSIHPIIVSILLATIFIAIWGIVDYALNNSKSVKAKAYDFNISGNQSYAKVIKQIANAANNKIRPAIKTTSIVFFNYLYTSVFEDIVLVKKNGSSISIKKLHDNPEYYIDKKLSLFNIISNNKEILTDLNYLLTRIADNEIKFVKEKEL